MNDDMKRLMVEKENLTGELNTLKDSSSHEKETNLKSLKEKDDEIIGMKNSENLSKEKISSLEAEMQGLMQNSGNCDEQMKVINDKLQKTQSELAESQQAFNEFQKTSKQESSELIDQHEFVLVECKTDAENKLKLQREEFSKTIEEQVTLISKLNGELDSEKISNLDFSATNKQLTAANNGLKDEMVSNKNNINEFEERILNVDRKNCEQKELNFELENRIEDLLKNTGNSNEQLNSLNTKLVSVEKDYIKCKETLDKCEQSSKKEISELKEQFEFDLLEYESKSEINAKTAVDEFNKQFEEKNSLITTLTSKIDSIKIENTENYLTIKKLKLENEFNSENSKSQLNTLKEFEDKSKLLEEKLSKDSQNNSELTMKLEILTKKDEESIDKLSSLNDQIQTLESELAKGKAELLESNRSANCDIEEAKQRFQLELNECKSTAEQRLTCLNEEHDTSINEKTAIITNLNRDLEVLNVSKGELNKKFDGLTLDIDSSNEKNKMLLLSINDFEEKLKISTEKNLQLDEKNCEINLRIETLMRNSGDSSEQLNCLNEKLSLAEKSLTENQDLLSQTKCEMKNKFTAKNQQFDELVEKSEIERKNLTLKIEEMLKEKDIECKKHENSLSKALEIVENNKSEMKTLSANVNILETKNNNHLTNIENLEKYSKGLEEKETNLKAENLALEKKLNEENINNNENLYLQLSENEKKFEEIIKQQEIEKNSQLKSKNTDFEHAISEKEKEILSLTNNHVQITNDKDKKLETLEVDISKLKVEMLESSTNMKEVHKKNLLEKDSLISSLNENMTKSNLEVDELKQNSSNLEKEIASLQDKLSAMNCNNDDNANVKNNEIQTLNAKLAEINNALCSKDNEIETSQSMVKEFKDLSAKLEHENKINLQDLENSNKQIDLYKLQMLDAKEKVEKLNSICQEQTKAYERENEECRKLSESCTTIKTEFETIMPKFMDLEEQVKLRDFQIMELNSKLEDSTTFTRAVVTSPPNSADLLLLTKENGKLKQENNQLQSDLYEQRNNCDVMQESLKSLSTKAAKPTSSANPSTSTNEDKNLIEFLNSIIAEYKQKNDVLQDKIDLLTNTNTANMNDSNVSDSNNYRNVPVRKFCDICEEFDLHETEDCPKQCNDSDLDNLHSHHQGDANSSRLYCDSCEVFGHTTENCNDQETF